MAVCSGPLTCSFAGLPDVMSKYDGDSAQRAPLLQPGSPASLESALLGGSCQAGSCRKNVTCCVPEGLYVIVQDLQFKLASYSSSVFASGAQQHFGPRRSEDGGAGILRGAFPLRATNFA